MYKVVALLKTYDFLAGRWSGGPGGGEHAAWTNRILHDHPALRWSLHRLPQCQVRSTINVDQLIIIDLWSRKTYLGPTENPKIKTTMRFLKCPLGETVNRGSLSSAWKDSEITFLGSSVEKTFQGSGLCCGKSSSCPTSAKFPSRAKGWQQWFTSWSP